MKKLLFVVIILVWEPYISLYSQTLQVSLSPDKTKVNRSAKNGIATIFFDSNIEDLRIVCTDQNPNEQVVKDEIDDGRWYVKIDVKKDLEDYGFCERIFLLKCSASAEYQLTIDSIAPNQVLYYTVTLPNELEPKLLEANSRRIASKAIDCAEQGDSYLARLLALEVLTPNMPYTSEAEAALRHANMSNDARFLGHTQKVNCIAISSDDRYLVSGADDHKVIIWDTKNANKLKELNIHKDDVESVQFSNDGQYLLTASSDTTIFLLDAKQGTIIHTYKNEHSAEISEALFGPRSTIISGDWNGNVVVWDMKTEKVLHKFKAHEKGELGLAVSGDSRFLLTYSNAQQYPMKIWDISTFSIIKRFSLEEKCSVNKAVFSPTSKQLLATLGAGKMKLYSTTNWEELEEREIELLGCKSACFSPDNKKIALGSTYGHDITILDAVTFDTLYVYQCEDKVRDVIFSHDSRMLIACDNSKKIYSWDLNYPFPYEALIKVDDIKKVRFSNGRCLFLSSGNKILEYCSFPDAKIKLKNSYTTKSNVFELFCSGNGDAYYSVVEKQLVDSHNNVITKSFPGASVFAKKQTVVSFYDLYHCCPVKTNQKFFEIIEN